MVKETGEKMKASDFIFCVDITDSETSAFCITSLKYWEENGCLCDGQEDEDVRELLPDGFHNLMEGCWEYCGDAEDGKRDLIAAGFQHHDGLSDFINNYDPSCGCGGVCGEPSDEES